MKRIVIGVLAVALAAGGGYAVFGGDRTSVAQGAEPEAVLAPVQAPNTIVAEGQVVPVANAALSLTAGGVVAEVAAGEGSRVAAGDLILRLESAQAEAALAQAQAGQAIAEANLAKLQAGAGAETVAAAEAAVAVARAGVGSAEGALADAQAGLARVQAGASVEEVAIAEREVERAKNALWGAQAQRDAVCGRVKYGGAEADCDSAEAAVNGAEEAVRIAELTLQQARNGARAEDVAAAQARVAQAEGGLATAQAQVARAEAELALAQRPATAEDLAAAEAQVQQSQAAVRQAEAALAAGELRAPFGGEVAWLGAKAGEFAAAGTPVARLADASAWQVETTDLSELSIARVQVGDAAILTFDALPDVELAGTVTAIKPLGELSRGEIAYTVVVTPAETEPRLRWNMTAAVTIEPGA